MLVKHLPLQLFKLCHSHGIVDSERELERKREGGRGSERDGEEVSEAERKIGCQGVAEKEVERGVTEGKRRDRQKEMSQVNRAYDRERG